MTTSDSTVAAGAGSTSQSVFRWPVLAVSLFLAAESAHTTMTEHFVTPFARAALLVGVAVAAIGWALLLHKERSCVRSARAALPYPQFRQHPPPIAGNLFRSLLFRWSLLIVVSVVTVEHVLEIVEAGPSVGSVAACAALAAAGTVVAIHRGVLSARGESHETPELAIEPNFALAHAVRNCGSLLLAKGIWFFALLILAAALLA